MKLFLSLFLWGALANAADLSWDDSSFGCLDRATANRYVDDFGIDAPSFGGLELCNNQVDTKKLFNDLQIVEHGSFRNENSNNTLIRGFVPADHYYAWLKSQTYGMNRGDDVPYATAYNRGGYFTMQNGWALLSTLGRVGVVLHEARHTEGYRHYRCEQGPYIDTSVAGCDTNYAAGGSHAVESEYYARVAVLGTNFHPAYKSMARLMAMARANFVFNQPVLHSREAVLAIDRATQTPVLFDGGRRFAREKLENPGRLKRTSFGASVFDGLRAFAVEMYENTAPATPKKDVYSYFKLLERMPAAVKDYEEYDVGARRFLASLSSDDRFAFYNFAAGAWGPSNAAGINVARTATTLPNGQRGYFFITPDGTVYPVDGARSTVGSALGDRWSSTVVNAVVAESRVMILRDDGTIYESNEGAWRPAAVYQGQWSDITNVPLYDAFAVTPE